MVVATIVVCHQHTWFSLLIYAGRSLMNRLKNRCSKLLTWCISRWYQKQLRLWFWLKLKEFQSFKSAKCSMIVDSLQPIVDSLFITNSLLMMLKAYYRSNILSTNLQGFSFSKICFNNMKIWRNCALYNFFQLSWEK